MSLTVEESEILQVWILIILGIFSLLIVFIPLHYTWPSSVVTLRKSFGMYLAQAANQPQRQTVIGEHPRPSRRVPCCVLTYLPSSLTYVFEGPLDL